LQQLVVSGDLACSKEDAASLACIQLRIEETWEPPASTSQNPSPTPTPAPTPMHHANTSTAAPTLKVYSPNQHSSPSSSSSVRLGSQQAPSSSQQEQLTFSQFVKSTEVTTGDVTSVLKQQQQQQQQHQYSSYVQNSPKNNQKESHPVFTFSNSKSHSSLAAQTTNITTVSQSNQSSVYGPPPSPSVATAPISSYTQNHHVLKDANHLRIPSTPLCGSFIRRQSHPQTNTPIHQSQHEDEQPEYERAHAKKLSIPASESFVGGAGDLFRGCYGVLDPHKGKGQPSMTIQRCLPPVYWTGKTMTRLIK
ncbi:hypothetical protein Anas_04138, partial [Armadillidium nasatum]